MKRGLVFTLCALAVAASGSVAHAQLGATDVALSLNLRYTDPADPSEGGTWYLLARTGSTDGIAGVSAFVQNINTAGLVLGGTYGGATVTSATLGGIVATAPNTPYVATSGGFVNFVYGQNTAAVENGSIKLDVGGGVGTAGAIGNDPLRNSTWNNSALIASGTFGGTRPVFGTAGTTATGANVLPVGATAVPPANSSLLATVTTTVRGDSEISLGLNTPGTAGLFKGDVDRNGSVNADDFTILALNFGDPAPVGGFGWDQGDFNDDGVVNADDFTPLALNFGDPAPPVANVAAVPEPASFGLLGLGALAMMAKLRRRS